MDINWNSPFRVPVSEGLRMSYAIRDETSRYVV